MKPPVTKPPVTQPPVTKPPTVISAPPPHMFRRLGLLVCRRLDSPPHKKMPTVHVLPPTFRRHIGSLNLLLLVLHIIIRTTSRHNRTRVNKATVPNGRPELLLLLLPCLRMCSATCSVPGMSPVTTRVTFVRCKIWGSSGIREPSYPPYPPRHRHQRRRHHIGTPTMALATVSRPFNADVGGGLANQVTCVTTALMSFLT
jgi:hypothetical protein